MENQNKDNNRKSNRKINSNKIKSDRTMKKSKNIIQRNNVNKKNKSKNKPLFLLIGLIFVILISIIIYNIFIKLNPYTIVDNTSYAITDMNFSDNLTITDEERAIKSVELMQIDENSTIFERLNSFFVNSDSNTQINSDYPMYQNDNIAVYNLSEEMKLITSNYEEIQGYSNFILSEKKMYNRHDLTRADNNEYIFLKNKDNMYINVTEIKVKTVLNQYTIPLNSIINFKKDYIIYYEPNEHKLEYKKIDDIDFYSEIEINGETMSYYEFLIKMNIVKVEEENDTESNEEANIVNETESQTTNQTNITPNNQGENENNDIDNKEKEYIKPEISSTDFVGNVYTATGNVDIKDPTTRITNITYTLKKEERTYLRVGVYSSGELKITGLEPDTEYSIIGEFEYLNENNIKQKETFYNGTIKTKDLSALETIKMTYENGDIYSNKIELKNLKIQNELSDEVLNGIAKIEITVNGLIYNISKSDINKLLNGESINYQTEETVKSDSEINYEIKIYDKFFNQLIVENNKGATRTSKTEPNVDVTIITETPAAVELEFIQDNQDDVELQNYYFQILKQNGEIVYKENLKDKKEERIVKDLSASEIYTIQVYADFDTEDGKGLKTNNLLYKNIFTVVDISSLGKIYMDVNEKENSSDSVKFDMKIDSDRTNEQLIQLISYIDIKLTDITTGEIISNRLSDEELENLKNNTIDYVEKTVDNLTSNTIYNVEVVATVITGNITEELYVEFKLDETNEQNQIITQKEKPIVLIKNEFVTKDKIFFDIKLEDIDNAIQNKEDIENGNINQTSKVNLELVNEQTGEIVKIIQIDTNTQDFVQVEFSNLEYNKIYILNVIAPTYNLTNKQIGYEENKELLEEQLGEKKTFKTIDSINANIEFHGLEKVNNNSKNLANVESDINWRSVFYGAPSYTDRYVFGKEYIKNTNTLSVLVGDYTSNSQQYYLYDISKSLGEDWEQYIGQDITISFIPSVKGYTSSLNSVYITDRLSTSGKTNLLNNSDYKTYFTEDNAKRFEYTTQITDTGLLGIYVSGKSSDLMETWLNLKDFQIELGSTATDYEPFKYNYQLTHGLEVEYDNEMYSISEITQDKPKIEFYLNYTNKDTNETETVYIADEFINKPNSSIYNLIKEKQYNCIKDTDYIVEIGVNISYYDGNTQKYSLDKIEFNTDNEVEIKSISNLEKYKEIQPKGNYLFINDIDLEGRSTFGYSNTTRIPFDGVIDFNGKKLIKNTYESTQYIFIDTTKQSVLKNLIFEIEIDNRREQEVYTSFVSINYGIIENVQINLSSSNPNEMINIESYRILTNYNYGTIKNIAINIETKIIVNENFTGVARQNWGQIENVYMYGSNIQKSEKTLEVNLIIRQNLIDSIIKNIYTLIDIEESTTNNINNTSGNSLVWENAHYSTAENIYSVNLGNSYIIDGKIGVPTITNNPGPVILDNYANIANIFYSNIHRFDNGIHSKITPIELNDINFQNMVLNSTNGFIVDELISSGYYPHLDFPDCMPKQEYNKLPIVEEKIIPEITTIETINNYTKPTTIGGDLSEYTDIINQYPDDKVVADIKLTISNPSDVYIGNIEIENIGKVEILETNQLVADGLTQLTVRLFNPSVYVSKYDIKSIEYGFVNDIKKYNEDQKVINIDLYKPITTEEEWKNIDLNDTAVTENYILMNDIDFNNENSIDIVINKTYSGKLDGNNKVIKNINILNQSNIFYDMNGGEIRNLIIDGYEINNGNTSDYNAFIRVAYQSLIENVHIKNVKIYSNNTRGDIEIAALVGKVSYGNGIKNSSVNNVLIEVNSAQTITIGGMVADLTRADIENSYVHNININAIDIFDSEGIGGLIGKTSGTDSASPIYFQSIKNCYVIGEINANTSVIGGIAGNLTGNIDLLENSYSNVKITSDSENIGGLIGINQSMHIRDNIVFGNVYTSMVTDNIGSAVGNQQTIEAVNDIYIYEEQLVNGVSAKNLNNPQGKLLSYSDISNEQIYNEILNTNGNNAYKIENIDNVSRLPKVYNKDEEELVKYQIDNEIENNLEDLFIQDFSYNIPTGEIFTVNMYMNIYHKQDIDIQNIIVDDMKLSDDSRIQEAVKVSSSEINSNPELKEHFLDVEYDDIYKTQINLKYSTTKAYDSYRVSNIEYTKENETRTQNLELKIDAKFYKVIDRVNDYDSSDGITGWNQWFSNPDNVGTYQNYYIAADLDFKDLSSDDIVKNVTIGRIKSNDVNEIKIISNVNILASGSDIGLIKMITKELEGISFEDIIINNSATDGENTGVIVYMTGNIKNINFLDINIEAPNIDYVAPIAINENTTQKDAHYITLNNITIKGNDYTGGLFAFSERVDCIFKTNIDNSKMEINNINITGNNYVGGIIGSASSVSLKADDINKTIDIKNIVIKGNTGVGGLVGHASWIPEEVMNINLYDINIEGSVAVGGIYGQMANTSTRLNNINIDIMDLEKNIIKGELFNIGGIIGYTPDVDINGDIDQYKYYLQNISVKNTEITGTNQVSAISAGRGFFEISNSNVENCIVKGRNNVAGILAYGHGKIDSCNVKNTTIEGSQGIGGIFGYGLAEIEGCGVTNTSIKGQARVGGIVGYFKYYNNDMKATIYNTFFESSNRTDIIGVVRVGGIAGEIEASTIISGVYTNANIEGSGDEIGGIVGHMGSTDSYTVMDNVYIGGAKIEGIDNVGGIIGRTISNTLSTPDKYINIYVDVDITAQNAAYAAVRVGNEKINILNNSNNIHVNKYSTINGKYVYQTDENRLLEDNYLLYDDLIKGSTYSNDIKLSNTKFEYSTTNTSMSKYPILKASVNSFPQLGIPIPEDPFVDETGFPEITILPISDNQVEVTFSSTVNGMTFDYINGNNELLNNSLNTSKYIFDFDRNTYILIRMKDISGNIIEKRFEPDEISPEIYLYSSGIDEINIDFSTIGNGFTFSYEYDNGNTKVENVGIISKTYTLKYDYISDITVKITNSAGKIINEKVFTADSIRNRTEVIPIDQDTLPDNIEITDNYYYLKGTSLAKGYLQITEITDSEGYVKYEEKMIEEIIDDVNKYLNIFNGKALRDNGEIYNLNDGQITNLETSAILKSTVNSLEEYIYNGQIIKRYGTYSTVDGVDKEYIYIVQNNLLQVIGYANEMIINNILVGTKNEYVYQAVLNDNNMIQMYKNVVYFPTGYQNSNIVHINSFGDLTKAISMYSDGQVIVFDYADGKLIYDSNGVETNQSQAAETSLLSFITSQLNLASINIFGNSNEIDKEQEEKYQIATNIEEQLREIPIEVAMNNLEITDENGEKPEVNQEELMNREYVTVYNPETNDYEVFKESELLDSEIEEPESETSKIQKQAQLNEYYYSNARESIEQTGSIYIYIIIGVIILSLFILRRYYIKTTGSSSSKGKRQKIKDKK